MFKLDSDWKYLGWLLIIVLLFFLTKWAADMSGLTSGAGVTIYMAAYFIAILILFVMWIKFFLSRLK